MKNITRPPVSRLESALDIDTATAKKLLARIKKGYRNSDYDFSASTHYSHAANRFMEELNSIAGSGFFGVESLYPKHPDIYYLNTGDSYAATLIFRPLSRTIRIGDIGSICE